MFGERLKRIRTERGLRQEDIGQIVQVGKSTVSQWEAGIHEPSLATIGKIADFFGVTTDYLLGRSDDPQGQAQRPDTDDNAAPRGNPLERLKDIRVAFRADYDLTDEDVDEILEFIEWRRQRKKK